MSRSGPRHFVPLQRQGLSDQAYRALRDAILRRQFQDGQRLAQEDLAKNFGISRVPIRDALKRLEADGLVLVDERGSCFVRSFSGKDAEEIYALRALVEPYVTAEATLRISDDDIEEMTSFMAQMEQAVNADDTERYVYLNRKFHMALYEASDLPRFIRIINSLWSGLPPMTPLTVSGQMARSLGEHRAILDALVVRDSAHAADLVRTHVTSAGESLKALLLS